MDNHTQYSGFAGVDLAKKVMQIHFVTEDGEITDKSTKRAEFLDFFRNRTKCLIGMEACGASQDWARKLEAMGHEVHLMSPKAVKPFVSGQKNDYNDAIGIYKAMFNGVRRVPVKSTEIRDLQTLRRIRSQVTKDKVKEINHVRGLLAEYGIVLGKSITAFNKGISSALESLKERGDVSPLVAEELRTTVEAIKAKIERQKKLDQETLFHFASIMQNVADQASSLERKAIDIEREVDDMKMAEYMEDHIGETFEGIVSSITNFGMFVELPNTIEGLIRMEDLVDDFYYFDNINLQLIGKRTGRRFKMSDKVKIKVSAASISARKDACIPSEELSNK